MWEAEPHHTVCHPVSLNSCSCLLTVILICTQHGARLEAVFVLPPQSQAHGRLRTSYFSSEKPRTFAFDFQIVLMSSCLFFLSLSFQQCYTKPQDHWTFLHPKEREERAAKPHNPSRGANSWLDVQTQRLALWSVTQIISVKVMLVMLCFRETGTRLSETGTPALSPELSIITQWTWHTRGPQRTANSKPTAEFPGLHRRLRSTYKYLHHICDYCWLKAVHLLSSLTFNELLRVWFLS